MMEGTPYWDWFPAPDSGLAPLLLPLSSLLSGTDEPFFSHDAL